MGKSFKIATLFGIPVFLHWTFPLLFLWIGYMTYQFGSEGVQLFLWLSALFILVFFCVVFHEFGHALTARRYGVETKDIILSPIGGVARLERLPKKPWHEFLVAAAGPLVNVVIFILLAIVSLALGHFENWWNDFFFYLSLEPLMRDGFGYFLLGSLLATNFVLVLFNLIPAFPMDGGRILRSLLSIPFGRQRATMISTRVAQVLAILGLIIAFASGGVILGLICLFVLMTSSQENNRIKVEKLLEEAKAGDVGIQTHTRIYEDQSINIPAELFANAKETGFLVYESDSNPVITGVLNSSVVLDCINANTLDIQVKEKMNRDIECITSSMNLKEVYELMQQQGYSVLPVKLSSGEIGKIGLKQINEYLQIRQRIKASE